MNAPYFAVLSMALAIVGFVALLRYDGPMGWILLTLAVLVMILAKVDEVLWEVRRIGR